MDKSAPLIELPRTHRTASPSIEELAAQQGVTPIDDFETLLGEPRPEDESADEFSASLRAWRREGSLPDTPR
jgi:hypothetical protein